MDLHVGRSPGGGDGNSLQYSFRGSPKDRRAWQAIVHGVARVGHDWACMLCVLDKLWIHLDWTQVHFPTSWLVSSAALDSVLSSVQSLSRVRLCDPMNCSTPGLPVHRQLPEFTQTHAHRVGDAIQPSVSIKLEFKPLEGAPQVAQW